MLAWGSEAGRGAFDEVCQHGPRPIPAGPDQGFHQSPRIGEHRASESLLGGGGKESSMGVLQSLFIPDFHEHGMGAKTNCKNLSA